MDDRRPGLSARLFASGRLVALVALSVVAGGIGGAWAVAGAPGLDRVTVMTVSDDGTATADDPAGKSAEPTTSKEPKEPKAAKTGRPTDAGKPSGAGKPPKSAKAAKPAVSGDRGQGVHGRCVSAVATSDATGGPNDNHGGAVSAAAKSCPHPTPAATASR